MGAVTILMLQKHLSLTIIFLMTWVVAAAVVADAGEATSWIKGDDVNRSSSGAIPCRSSSGDGCLVADDVEMEFLPMDLGTSPMLAATNGGGSGTGRTMMRSNPSVACERDIPYTKCLPDENGKRPPCPQSPYRRAC